MTFRYNGDVESDVASGRSSAARERIKIWGTRDPEKAVEDRQRGGRGGDGVEETWHRGMWLHNAAGPPPTPSASIIITTRMRGPDVYSTESTFLARSLEGSITRAANA